MSNHETKVETTNTHDKRFCGRCQSWLPDVIELHACKKAPRPTKQSEGDTKWIGYAWYEHDEHAIEARKGVIVTDGRPFKPGSAYLGVPFDGDEA